MYIYILYIYIIIYLFIYSYHRIYSRNSGPVDSAECQATGAGYNRMAALRIFMRRLSAAALRGQRFSWVATANYKLVYKP